MNTQNRAKLVLDTTILKEKVHDLKKLDPIEQEYEIHKISKEYGFSVTAIRSQLKNHYRVPQPKISVVTEVEPYHEKVVGLDILQDILHILTKYIVLPKSTALPITLWILLTYCFQYFRILPILAVISPEKRCGKTTLLEVIQGLANKALMASNISMAAVYRVVEKYSPTLIIDEADTSLPSNDELRGILNSGHTKASGYVIRVNPETLNPEKFCTFNPKAIGMIGKLSDTLHDRSIVIPLRRKLANEKTLKLDIDFEEQNLVIRQKCVRWAADNADSLREIRPDTPVLANDRATDNWAPLLAIAKRLGDDCFENAKTAMLDILDESSEDDSIGTKLLFDIRAIFETHRQKHISSDDLVNGLIGIKEGPWAECGRNGKPLTQMKLASLLKGFGLRSKNIKYGGKVLKGYALDDFQDVFVRYLPDSPLTIVATPLPFNNNSFLRDTTTATTP